MARLLHRVSINEQAIAADGIQTFDLPVNPLSVLLLVLRPLNETANLSHYKRIFDIADAINRATVLFRGVSLFSMSGRDIVAYNYHRHGIVPQEANPDDTNNERRAVVLPLVFGRHPYDSNGCIPASRRGELQLELDFDIASEGYDDLRISAESIELLGAKPKFVERKVTLSQTFGATGDNDVQMPPGNVYRGILGFGTTDFTGASPAPSLGRLSLYVDGQEAAYSSADFETLVAASQLLGRQPFGQGHHTHRVDATGVATEETFSLINIGASDGMQNYCWMDLDPTRDDEFSVDTGKAMSVYVRSDAETADAIRLVTIEAMKP